MNAKFNMSNIRIEKGFLKRPHYLFSKISDTDDPHQFLNEYEIKVYNSYKIPKRKKEWLCSRILAKKLISSLLKIPFKSIIIKNDEDRKPYAIAGGKKFYISISHRKDLAAVAINYDFSPYIGIDVETCDFINKEMLSDFMSERELSNTDDKIIEIWCIKESILKMCGKGLSLSTKDIEYKSNNLLIKDGLLDVLNAYKISKIYYETFKTGDYVISLCSGG